MFVAAVKFCSYSTIHIILMYNILLGAVSEISNIFTGATFCCTSHGLETAHTEVSCLYFLCTIFFLHKTLEYSQWCKCVYAAWRSGKGF